MSNFIIYVDGSYNAKTHIYGGGYLILAYDLGTLNTKKSKIGYFNGNHATVLSQRQIVGECGALLIALQKLSKVFDQSVDTLEIRFDYIGLEHWYLGSWKAKKPVALNYIIGLQPYRGLLKPEMFSHIRGHTGELGNEYVDKVARFSVGVDKSLPRPPYFATDPL